jgi:hypothetical protein
MSGLTEVQRLHIIKNNGVIPTIKTGYMAAPCLTNDVDYSTFEKDPVERGNLWSAKRNHKKALKKAYGKDAHKHLNVPGKELPAVKFTF